jgi:hypothetical protein
MDFAGAAEDEYKDLDEQGFITLILLTIGVADDPAGTFASTFQLSMPVLDDHEWQGSGMLDTQNITPYYILLGRDMTVRDRGEGPLPIESLDAALADPWPDVDRPESYCD